MAQTTLVELSEVVKVLVAGINHRADFGADANAATDRAAFGRDTALRKIDRNADRPLRFASKIDAFAFFNRPVFNRHLAAAETDGLIDAGGCAGTAAETVAEEIAAVGARFERYRGGYGTLDADARYDATAEANHVDLFSGHFRGRLFLFMRAV